MTGTKKCSACKEEKLVDSFYKNKAMKDGFNNQCKKCNKKYTSTKASLAGKKKYRDKNKEELSIKAKILRSSEEYKIYNSVRQAKRRADKFKATPSWANLFFIEEAYRLSKLRTNLFGFEWHVDHIVPLKGKNVCGLHVEYNLQVIPKQENLVKSNKFEDKEQYVSDYSWD